MLVSHRYESSSPHPCSTHAELTALPAENAFGRTPALSPSSKEVRATGERGAALPALLFGAEATSCSHSPSSSELDCSTAGCRLSPSPTGPSRLSSSAAGRQEHAARTSCKLTVSLPLQKPFWGHRRDAMGRWRVEISAAGVWFAPAEGGRQINRYPQLPGGRFFSPSPS